VRGNVAQAGVINGGVHMYAAPAAVTHHQASYHSENPTARDGLAPRREAPGDLESAVRRRLTRVPITPWSPSRPGDHRSALRGRRGGGGGGCAQAPAQRHRRAARGGGGADRTVRRALIHRTHPVHRGRPRWAQAAKAA
jgi:hypothetical protein